LVSLAQKEGIMKVKVIMGALALVCSTAATHAQGTQSSNLERTAHFPNGRAWTKYTYEMKLGFVMGYEAGLGSMVSYGKTFMPKADSATSSPLPGRWVSAGWLPPLLRARPRCA
jgi:hypothetical protein